MKPNPKGRLILICGMSGVGKSTTAQLLSHQFSLHSLPYRWMHEEIAAHPIRDGEFMQGDLNTTDGMEKNVRVMYRRWQALADRISASNQTHIMEGCFFQAIDRYFAESVYTKGQAIEYFGEVLEILARAGSLLVYLHSGDVRKTLEQVYQVRGAWWKELKMSGERYFGLDCEDEASLYRNRDEYQKIASAVFDNYAGDKLKLDSSVGRQDGNVERILHHIGLPYIKPVQIPMREPERYCGIYEAAIEGETQTIEIKYDSQSKILYCAGFWPYMKLRPIADNAFEMESFPITLTFTGLHPDTVHVTGEYDWSIVGTIMKKCAQGS